MTSTKFWILLNWARNTIHCLPEICRLRSRTSQKDLENLPRWGNHAQLADPCDSHPHIQGRRKKRAGELQACLPNKSPDQNLREGRPEGSGRAHGAKPSLQHYAARIHRGEVDHLTAPLLLWFYISMLEEDRGTNSRVDTIYLDFAKAFDKVDLSFNIKKFIHLPYGNHQGTTKSLPVPQH